MSEFQIAETKSFAKRKERITSELYDRQNKERCLSAAQKKSLFWPKHQKTERQTRSILSLQDWRLPAVLPGRSGKSACGGG